MATIQENKAYIEDSSRFPKLQSVELVQPRYQFTNEEYNRIVEYLGQLYTLSQSAVTSVDASLDVASTKPLENRVVAAAIARLTSTANRIKISFFKGIEQSGTVRQTSSPLSSEPEEVSFYEDAGTFGFKPSSGEGIVTTQYYNNWQNRDEYTDENLEPYTAKVYYCIDDKTLYVFDDGELVRIGGDSNIEVDTEGEGDLDISDMNGNVLGRFENGHFRTKNFYSGDACTEIGIDTDTQSDLDITDMSGNVLGRFERGHFRTKNFNSANYYTKAEIDAIINQLLSQINS